MVAALSEVPRGALPSKEVLAELENKIHLHSSNLFLARLKPRGPSLTDRNRALQ